MLGTIYGIGLVLVTAFVWWQDRYEGNLVFAVLAWPVTVPICALRAWYEDLTQ